MQKLLDQCEAESIEFEKTPVQITLLSGQIVTGYCISEIFVSISGKTTVIFRKIKTKKKEVFPFRSFEK